VYRRLNNLNDPVLNVLRFEDCVREDGVKEWKMKNVTRENYASAELLTRDFLVSMEINELRKGRP
jgi:hypothetical protein